MIIFNSEQEMEGVENDWLYIVISDIVNRHNTFIDALYHRVRAEKICTVGYCLPSEPHEIPITEYTEHHCIVHNSATRYGIFISKDTIVLAFAKYLLEELLHPNTTNRP